MYLLPPTVMTANIFALLSIAQLSLATTFVKNDNGNPEASLDRHVPALKDPPATWQEHWYNHNGTLQLRLFDDNIAIYGASDVVTPATKSRQPISLVWSYAKQKYGSFGTDPRLYTVIRPSKYSGGHFSTYLNASHDHRNTIDLAVTNSTAGQSSAWFLNQIGHIVEFASNNISNSPAFHIWRNNWGDIFIFDVLLGLGYAREAVNWQQKMIRKSDNSTGTPTFWFRDWFVPIYTQQGNATSLNRFFALLAMHFPKSSVNNITQYSRNMNFGEFVHFWSGATRMDLTLLALTAFGNIDQHGKAWTLQLQQARITFPNVSYAKDITCEANLTVSKDNEGGSLSDKGSLKLTDCNYSTSFVPSGFSTEFWIQLSFQKPETVTGYSITLGANVDECDFKTWNLTSSNNGVNYTRLDGRRNETFCGLQMTKTYFLKNTQPYKFYRLFILTNNGSKALKLNEFRVLQ